MPASRPGGVGDDRQFEAIYGRRAVGTAGLIYDQPSQRNRTETFSQFAFIGAYWFIMQDLIWRYFNDDLKTGAYISAPRGWSWSPSS